MTAREKFSLNDTVYLNSEGLSQRFQVQSGVVVGFVPNKPALVRIRTHRTRKHKAGIGIWNCRFWDKALTSSDELPPDFGSNQT